MQTWDDCIASLQAGASAESLLPKVRALFDGLGTGGASATKAGSASEAACDRLDVQLDGGVGFTMPYLRAPLFVWKALRDGDGCAARDMFDSELDVDLLSQFQPRFVGAARGRVRRLLGEASGGDGGCDWPVCADDGRVERRDDGQFTGWDATRVARALRSAFEMEALGDAPLADDARWETFGVLSEAQWGLALSMMGTVPIRLVALRRLMLCVNQMGFSRAVLRCVLPFVLVGRVGMAIQDDDTGGMDEVLAVVDAAAVSAALEELCVEELRDILDVYRGMEIGVLGALVQLRIVQSIKF